MIDRRAIVVACTLAGLVATPAAASGGEPLVVTSSKQDVPADRHPARTDRILVRFDAKQVALPAQSLRVTAVGGSVNRNSTSVPGLVEVAVPSGTMHHALEALKKTPGVLYAEPDYIRTIDLTPNDPSFVDLWGMHNTGQTGGTPDADIDAPEAWDIRTDSTAVVVGVIDTGIDYNHPDLAPNLFINPGDCTFDGIDDDGNGYVDDCFGINAITGSGDPMDDNGHGTHVSGTIGARGNNAEGVVGVNQQARIANCKFLDAFGSGATSDAIECFDYFASLFDAGNPIRVTNNSWGGGGLSQGLFDAITAQQSRGILTVAAAGNDGSNNDASPSFPASYDLPTIVSVAATDHNDAQAGFSNFGSASVDIGAPGGASPAGILSTWPPAVAPFFSYLELSGTSMAAPHVAGAATLLAGEFPGLNVHGLRNRTLVTGDPVPALTDTTATGTRLNVNGMLGCGGVQQQRLMPGNEVIIGAGGDVTLRMISFNCTTNMPAAPTDVLIGGQPPVPLLDNGLGADQLSGDGIFSALWTPPGLGDFELTFPDGSVTNIVVGAWTFAPRLFSFRTGLPASIDLGDDSAASPLVPFDIPFGNDVFSGAVGTLWFSANGFVNFGGGVGSPVNTLPPFPVEHATAVFWDDLDPTAGGTIRFGTLGAAPNREFVISWEGIPHFGCGGNSNNFLTFQIVFRENRGGSFIVNYKDVTASSNVCGHLGASATVATTGGGLAATVLSFNQHGLANNTSYLWSPLAPHQPDLMVSKASSGPFRGDNIINTTGASQTMGKHGRKDVDKTFYVRLENEGATSETFMLKQIAKQGGLKVTWFLGGVNVSAQVRAGMPIVVNGGAIRTLRTVLRFTKVFPKGTKRNVALRALFDPGGDALADVVKLQLNYPKP